MLCSMSAVDTSLGVLRLPIGSSLWLVSQATMTRRLLAGPSIAPTLILGTTTSKTVSASSTHANLFRRIQRNGFPSSVILPLKLKDYTTGNLSVGASDSIHHAMF